MSKAVFLLALLLSGCETLGRGFENRIACSADGARGFFVSLYMRVGVASVLADDDTQVICTKAAK